MSDIKVDTTALKTYAARLNRVNGRLVKLDVRLDSLYYKVGLQDLWNLMKADLLTSYSYRLKLCADCLNKTADDFEKAEILIRNYKPTAFYVKPGFLHYFPGVMPPLNPHFPHVFPIPLPPAFLGAIASGTLGFGAVETALSFTRDDLWKSFWAGDMSYTDEVSFWSAESEDGETFSKFLTGSHTNSFTPSYGGYKNKKILGDDKHWNINHSQQKKEKEEKQVNKDNPWYGDPKATILEAKAEAKIEGSVLDGKLSGSSEHAEGSLEGKVLTGEAHASAAAGLYVYSKDKDGNVVKTFSPGVSAEVGASASVLEGSAEGRLGLGENKNMLGVYGDVDAKVLSAEAKGKVAVNAHEVYAGASAEANLVKVSGSAGVAVLGTDVGVTAGVKVGVGAHAEVGYTDGKFKVDIGAAVGVGFDLGLEVDVSGTVDAVCDIASSIADGAEDLFDGTMNAVSDAWNWLFG